MKLNSKIQKAIRDNYNGCVYILRDGIVVRATETVYHRKKAVSTVEIAYVQRGEITVHACRYNNDERSSPVDIGGIGSHDARVLMDGIKSIDVALHSSSQASRAAGIHIDTYTLETPSGARHRSDNVNSLISGIYFLIDTASTVDLLLKAYLPDAVVEDVTQPATP